MENIENKLPISVDGFYEIIHEDGDLISYEEEQLDKILDSIILDIEPTHKLEKEIAEKIQKAVKITEYIFSTIDQFVEDAALVEEDVFIGFHEDLQKDAKNSAMKTLDIAVKLRENDFLSLVPVVRDLTTRIEWIELILSKNSIEQMKNASENRKTAINRLSMINEPSTSNQ
jgi:hypothetical protein